MSDMAKKDVFIYVTKYGFEYVLSAKIYCLKLASSFDTAFRFQLTLAKKLEAVQSSTVTSNNIIPNVLRATFSNPTLPRNPPPPFSEFVFEPVCDISRCNDGLS